MRFTAFRGKEDEEWFIVRIAPIFHRRWLRYAHMYHAAVVHSTCICAIDVAATPMFVR
jgi:hypothetical protein